MIVDLFLLHRFHTDVYSYLGTYTWTLRSDLPGRCIAVSHLNYDLLPRLERTPPCTVRTA
jgi:hypothetical protein